MTLRISRYAPGLASSALSPILCLLGAFGGVHVAVDHLKIGHAPIRQQLGPRRVAALAPDAKQRHAVVDLGGFPKPPAQLRAPSRLQAPEHAVVVARRVPKPPRHHAGGVPVQPCGSSAVPQVAVPAEAIDRLAADAAVTRTARELRLAVGYRDLAGRFLPILETRHVHPAGAAAYRRLRQPMYLACWHWAAP